MVFIGGVKKRALFALFFTLLFLALSLLVYAFLNRTLYVPFYVLSVFFLITWVGVFFLCESWASPMFFFNFLFLGYPLSGLYFSFSMNFEFAHYFTLVEGFDAGSFLISIIVVYLGYLSLIAGLYFSSKIPVPALTLALPSNRVFPKWYTVFLWFLFGVGFFYWLWLSFYIAGGPWDLLTKVGVFHTVLKEGITTWPYLLSVGAVTALFLNDLQIKGRPTWPVGLSIVLCFLMLVSKGRLSSSVFFLVTFLVVYGIHNRISFGVKHLILVFFIVMALIFLYFARFMSNIIWIGASPEAPPLVLAGKLLFGRTNVGDLQSVVIGLKYVENYGILAGETFFDFTRFWLNRLFGFDFATNSVGIRLKEAYFPNISGAPAPGFITELILNFGLWLYCVFGFCLSFFLGAASKVLKGNDVVSVFIYSQFLFFMMILVKVDSTAVQGFIWALIPLFVVVTPGMFLQYAARYFRQY